MKVSHAIKYIKDNVDIVQVVSEYVRSLKKSGKNWVGLCPFHNDKKPSFSVSEDYKIYKCFSCGESGDVIKFVEKIEGVHFIDSLRLLAQRCGVTIDDSENDSVGKERTDLIVFNKRITSLFRYFLEEKKEGKVGLQYFESRGINKELREIFQLGYAPREFGRLLRIITERGYKQDFLKTSGIFSPGQNGLKTLFFNRIMFPIYNYLGECVGFGGRILDKDAQPKYLNTPETVLYKKSNVLYGIHTAKDEIRSTGKVFIVEGYIDVISCYKNGIKNVVAPCGTAITTGQLNLLARFATEIILLLDGDEAGMKGAFKALKESANLENIKFSVVTLPDAMDPDDFFIKRGREEFDVIVNNRIEAFDFCVNYVTKGANLKDYSQLSKVLFYLFDYIQLWKSSIIRDLLIDRLSTLLNINSESVIDEYQRFSMGNYKNISSNEQTEFQNKEQLDENNIILDQKLKAELDLIIFLHLYTENVALIKEYDFNESYFMNNYTLNMYKEAVDNNFNKSFLDRIENGTVLDYVTEKLMSPIISDDYEVIKQCAIDFIIDIKRKFWTKQIEEIAEKIKLSEMYNDYDFIRELQMQKEIISDSLLQLNSLQELKK